MKRKKKKVRKKGNTKIRIAQSRIELKKYMEEDFFCDGLDVDTSRIFPTIVMATMSSGKSTLINAILGEEILPSENQACTSKMFAILDDDKADKIRLYVTREDGSTVVIEDNIAEELRKINRDEKIKEVLISGEIRSVRNTQKALLIIDTPGPNNSRDDSHKARMEKIMGKLKGGLILYIINATQMGIKDDACLIDDLKEFLERKREFKVLFIINKVDALDFEKESIKEMVLDVSAYLEGRGIKEPEIVPVSALSAYVFKKVLNGETLTRSQYREFLAGYDLFKPQGIRLDSYALKKDYKNQYDKISVRDEKYEVSELMSAIENTGITYVEKYIQYMQISSDTLNASDIR